MAGNSEAEHRRRLRLNLELNALKLDPDGVNFVSRTPQNNGVSAKVKLVSGEEPIEAGMLTVAGGGSVAETFLQPEPFYSGRDLLYLRPKVPMSVEQKGLGAEGERLRRLSRLGEAIAQGA